MSVESRETLYKLARTYDRNIIFPETGEMLKRFEQLGMIPYRGAFSVYLRLFFSEMIDVRGKRVLYLDADTIVNGSLQSFLSMI